ncbi:MAG: hypothetical protein BA864_08395 [Desulfuromonadales bacterium C00003093]|nr:MAG: hypothetical protein BA864_08395 [Desulfuromonadales bacterium C00003093]
MTARYFLMLILICFMCFTGSAAAGRDEKDNEDQVTVSPEDMEIIRHMEILELMDLLENMDVLKDLDVLIED